MKAPTCCLIAALLLTPMAQAGAANPHQHGSGAVTMTRNAGQLWPTDAPLRQGMNAIHSATAAVMAQGAQASKADYDAFSRQVTTQVGFIINNCKLSPDADAQLHVAIASILAGADVAAGKHKGVTREAGVRQVAQALNAYGAVFDHPQWKALAVPH